MNVSQTLRTWRARSGYSQDYVARKMGVSIAQWSKIEREEKPFPLHFLSTLSRVFDVPASELVVEMLKGEPVNPYASSSRTSHAVGGSPGQEELLFYKNLAKHYEEKYLALFKLLVEKEGGADSIG